MERGGIIYILTNDRHSVLYTGVTSDLVSRMYKHIHKTYSNSFTKKYNVYKLVYFEIFPTIEEAIAREKQIKAGSRSKKEELINRLNPQWKDLYNEILKW
jgi:putative endonuclease